MHLRQWFQINRITLIFENDKIVFSQKEKTSYVDYPCYKLLNSKNLDKSTYESLYQVLKSQILFLNDSLIFKPIIYVNMKLFDTKKFTHLHQEFFSELELDLPVRKLYYC